MEYVKLTFIKFIGSEFESSLNTIFIVSPFGSNLFIKKLSGLVIFSGARVIDSAWVFYVIYNIQKFYIRKFIFDVKLNHFVQSVNYFTFASIFFLMAVKFFNFNFDDTHLREG